MTATVTIDEIIELMEGIGLQRYLSFQVGKRVVHALVHPRTLLTLSVWEGEEGIAGHFTKETEEHLLQLAFKKYVVQSGMTYAAAQRKARDLVQDFIGGIDGTTEASRE